MHYVYLLRSQKSKTKTYIGYTSNLKKRLSEHNQGQAVSTALYKPWIIETYIVFSEKQKALAFESYLKSHSGRAFSRKRLWCH